MDDDITGIPSGDAWHSQISTTWNSGSTPLEDVYEAARRIMESARAGGSTFLPLHEPTLSVAGTGYVSRLTVDERLMLMIFEQRASEVERGLLAALLDNPSDAAARGCYVDFLLEQGRCASAQLVRNGYTPGVQAP